MSTIDNSYLLTLFGGTSQGVSGGSARSFEPRKTPTAPWSSGQAVAEPSALVRRATGGADFIDEDAAVVDVKAAAADYRKLFALHQGLTTLNALVNRADTSGLSSGETSRVQSAFARGLEEVRGYLASAEFEAIRLTPGTSRTDARGTVGALRDTNRYVTGVIHQGSAEAEVRAFQGDVRFSIGIGRSTGDVTVDIDLADMGSQPRTLGNVISHINAALEAANVQTRLGRETVAGEPRTLTVGGRTITLPETEDRWALAVKGVSVETVSFSAPDTADGVYVIQGLGSGGSRELLKFQADTGVTGTPAPATARPGETNWVDGRALQTGLGVSVDAVRASATGPDGSLYVLAEVTGAVDGQPIKGQRDLALIKYDSAGQPAFVRTLGAASEATGGAIAVSADGRIAVAGSVTGGLGATRAAGEASIADSLVAVFDAAGDELWTQRVGGRAEDRATAVAFDASGGVIVGGQARSAMPGAGSYGGLDGYVMGFTRNGTAAWTRQFGTSGDEAVAGVAVSGNSLVVASEEAGRATLRRFDLQPTGGPVAGAVRDLGALSGSLTGLAISDDRVILAGTTRNAALGIGQVTSAHQGGQDAFIAALDLDLVADADERLTYVGGSGNDTGAAVTVAGGKVWLAGQVNLSGTGEDQTATGRLMRIDPETGTVEFSRDLPVNADLAQPLTVAVGTGAASVLDRLGLPSGRLDFEPSRKVVATTAARAGDQFHLDVGSGRLRTVTVEARDTFASLARKIAQASDNRLKVEVVKSDDRDVLKLTPRDGRGSVQLLAGAGGRDALEALGLGEVLLTPAGELDDSRSVFGLKLPADLSLDSKAAIKAAGSAIQDALSAVRAAYRELERLDRPRSQQQQVTGEAPAYLQSQLANYQAALSRLTGGS